MKTRLVLAAFLLVALGFAGGLAAPVGPRESQEVPGVGSSLLPVEASPSSEGRQLEDGAGSIPPVCERALAAAEQLSRFLPEAVSRVRLSYERSQEGAAAPPASTVISQIQSQAQALQDRFDAANQSCRTASVSE